jgi:hypothetical protein
MLKLVEGIVGRVPYKGRSFESIHQFVGGIRAGKPRATVAWILLH